MKGTRWAIAAFGAVALGLPPAAAAQTGPDAALGNGLGRLLDTVPSPLRARGVHLDPNRLAIRDADGRVLVDLTAREGVAVAGLRRAAEAVGLRVTAVDAAGGTIEGYIALDRVRTLAGLEGAGTLAQSLKPELRTGSVTSQGVAFERVDRLPSSANGEGITVAALSDSFDGAQTTLFGDPLTIHAADDVRTGDLPGPGNPVNAQPVVVLTDDTSGFAFDEGRAMLQLVHDVAPKSKLCFATAGPGLVAFAENVRALADKKGRCGADVLVDDAIFFDEPFFSDSVLSDAIDDVSAKGAHYFSSAGNEGDAQSWDAPVRLVDPERYAAAAGLDFSGVDPALYDGGVQDMDPGQGTDIAQTMHVGPGGGLFDLQWDDPVDLNGAKLAPPILSTTGEITAAAPEADVPFTTTTSQVGRIYQVKVDAIPSGTTDLILGLVDPSGNLVQQVDTGSSPEQLAFTVTEAGTYTLVVTGFDGDVGDFTLTVAEVLSPSRVTTDFNVLLFDTDGTYLGAVADTNPLSGRPSEIAGLGGPGDVQLVIARAGTGPFGATRLRNVLFDDMGFTEYSDPLAPAAVGHVTARSAIGVGAYDPFKPYLPEYFTSPGGDLPIMFDSAGDRYPSPSIRRVPSVSATDGGNTTFFVADTVRDPDTFPNFFGTSASAPHAAAIAALVLQREGGGTSLSTEALRRRLERSTFAHDLDPDYAAGSAHRLRISAAGPQGAEDDSFPPSSMIDPRFFRVDYSGRVPLRSIEFVGETANPTGFGGPGIVFDDRPFGGETPFSDGGFPFTVGATSGGLNPADVGASFAGQTAPGQFRRLILTFAGKGLARGRGLAFGIDRDEAHTAAGDAREGNGADSLGGATFIPQRIPEPFGLVFIATRTDGRRFVGAIRNRLGHGWTPLDGYGVIDAEKAVEGGRHH